MLNDAFYKRAELEAVLGITLKPTGGRANTWAFTLGTVTHTVTSNEGHALVWTPEGTPADRALKTLNIERLVA